MLNPRKILNMGSSALPPSQTPGLSDAPTHTRGTAKGEEWVKKHGREPGRHAIRPVRTARDATSLNPQDRDPIDPRMPHIPPQ